MSKYKNILWIDDCDDKNTKVADLEDELNSANQENTDNNSDIDIIKKYFGNFSDDVKLIRKLKGAIEEIDKTINSYDLIVFDINMNNGLFDYNLDEIKKKFKYNKVYIDIDDFNKFKEIAGMYLYLYLLNLGYPNKRMLFLTGNSIEDRDNYTNEYIKFLKDAHIYPGDKNDENRIIFEKNTIPNLWIQQYYKDEYYKVRRLVFKACEYWREFIFDNKRSDEDIPYNKIYYKGKDKEQNQISKESFENIFNRIEMLMPVVKPTDPKSVYYQIMQVLTMFHENSADIRNLNNYERFKPYHLVARTFRNWSAHNKFQTTTMEADEFALIFCITLDTYFREDNTLNNNHYIYYVNEYFSDLYNVDDIFDNTFKKQYIKTWINKFEILKEHSNKNKKNNSIQSIFQCKNISDILKNCGNCNLEGDKKLKISDLLLLLFGERIKSNPESKDDGKNSLPQYSIYYTWDEDNNISCENLKNEEYLKYCAYILFKKTT